MKVALAFLFLASSPLTLAAVSLPYANDFSSSAADFNSGGSGNWSTGGGLYTNSIPTDGASYSLAQTTGLGGSTKQSFSMSTVITAVSGGSTSVGFAVLSNANASTFILADLFSNGNLRFRPFSGGGPTGDDISLATSIRYLNITDFGSVDLSVTGIYNSDNSLTLTLSATQGTTTTSHSTTIASGSLPTGNYFGFRNRNNTGSENVIPYSVSFDSISIDAVPEPSTTLLAVGFLGLAGMRRRR
jgi:uncharacterized protein (TIGR03382 family)